MLWRSSHCLGNEDMKESLHVQYRCNFFLSSILGWLNTQMQNP